MVIDQVFSEPASAVTLASEPTILLALRRRIAEQLTVLDDTSLTGTGRSSSQILELSAATLAEKLTGYLVREIIVRGSRGGPLEPLAAQLSHDITHMQGQRLEGMIGQLATQVQEALSRLDIGQPASLRGLGTGCRWT